jgi:hypothetical protein
MHSLGHNDRWVRLKELLLSRGLLATILQILSGRANRLSLKLARLSCYLTYASFARFSPAENKSILSRNRELTGSLIGRRAFVVATGPSISQVDLRRLDGEFVIAVNESVEALAKAGTRVSAIVVVDPVYSSGKHQYSCLLANIADYARAHNAPIFLNIDNRVQHERTGVFHGLKIYYLDHAGDLVDLAPLKPSYRIDLSQVLPGLHTVSHFALAVALGCGAKQVYLIGVDLDQIVTPYKPIRHGYGANQYNDHDGLTTLEAYAREKGWDYTDILYHTFRQQQCFRILGEIAARNGQHVFNASPAGLLEVLPRVSFESIFTEEWTPPRMAGE